MNRGHSLNPGAVAFWIMCSGIGWLIDGNHGAVVGLVCSIALSLILSAIDMIRKDQ